MLQKTPLIIISFLALSGFSSCLPKRPVKEPHEICIYDWERDSVYCGMTGGSTTLVPKPTSYLHKAYCRTPKNEEINQKNLHSFEAYADSLEDLINSMDKKK